MSATTTQALINSNGAGTVLPVTPTPSPVVSNGIGLSTQLIIWGMVGFILVELLAIMCLLRYCCRARYIRKRKYKEKEIILSDSSNIKETKPQFFMGGRKGGITTSQADHEIQHYAVEERQSVSSLHPILTSMPQASQVVCHQETIMVEDGGPAVATTTTTRTITPPPQPPAPIYSQPAPRSTLHVIHHHVSNSDDEMQPPPPPPQNVVTISDELYTNADENRMRQELSSEDIYTLRFSTSVAPLPPPPPPTQHISSAREYDQGVILDEIVTTTTSNPRQQQNYLYNSGTLNRPAFEIISHADVRPATPITFEHVKELSPRSQSEFESMEYNNPYRNNYPSNRRKVQHQHQIEHQHHHYHHHNQQPQHQTQAQAYPLSFGDERSFAENGERVEWQVAHELRTTDWDRLKELTGANDPPAAASSCRYATIDEYERSQQPQHQRIYERIGPYDTDVNSRHANNTCSCANINCTRTSSCKCREWSKKLTQNNNGHESNDEEVVVEYEYQLTNNNNAQTTNSGHHHQHRIPTYVNDDEDDETVDLRRSQSQQIIDQVNNNDEDEDEIFKIGELPPPPAQFQQQQQQQSTTNNNTTSRKNSTSFVVGMEEALRVSNEIDLKNDSISLYTTMNQTPKERRHTSVFEAVLGEIKTFKRSVSSDADRINDDEAQLY